MKQILLNVLFLLLGLNAKAQWAAFTPNFGDTIRIYEIDVLNENQKQDR